MKMKLGVIFGGATVEHEISIISAVQAMENLDKDKYEIIPIYISKQKEWYTGNLLMDISLYKNFDDLKGYAKKCILCRKNDKFFLQSLGLFKKNITELDIVLPIVHGNNAEDGTLVGFLETIGIPYVGSGVIGSAIGQDKVIQKQIFTACDIPIVDYIWFFDEEYFNDKDLIFSKVKKIGYPVIVKPATLGSSIGISIAKNEHDLEMAIDEATKYDSKILVEACVDNLREVNCAVVGDTSYQETSMIAEMKLKNEFLTFDDKYVGSGNKKGIKSKLSVSMDNSDFKIPATLNENLESQVYELAKKVFKVLNLSGVVRVDFLIDSKNEKVFVNEPNIIPGSLSFYMFNKNTKNYSKLLDEIITIAIRNYRKKNKKITSFDNNILTTYNKNKGLKGSKSF